MSVIKIINLINDEFIGYISTADFYKQSPTTHSKQLADALRSPHHLLVAMAAQLNARCHLWRYVVVRES